MRKHGTKIEFLIIDNYFLEVIDILKVYNCIFTYDSNYNSTDKLVLKPEGIVKGCELNIPPGFIYLEELSESFSQYVHFNERCTMHIHVDSEGIDLEKLNTYYINNESSIISSAGYRYAKLNTSNSKKFVCRRKNMNIVLSNIKHATVEHRIYKATFNYDDIMFAVNQTLQIIEDSQN